MTKQLRNYESTMALKELGEEMTIALSRWARRTEPSSLWQSCASCTHMKKTGPAFCDRYKLVPPVHVIIGATDCEGFVDHEEIPF